MPKDQYRDYEDEEMDHGASLGRGGVDPELHRTPPSDYSGKYEEDVLTPADRQQAKTAAQPKDAKYDTTPAGERRMDSSGISSNAQKNRGDFAQENYGATAEHKSADREWMNRK